MILTPGMSFIIMLVYGVYKLWAKERPTDKEMLFAIGMLFISTGVVHIEYSQRPKDLPKELEYLIAKTLGSENEEQTVAEAKNLAGWPEVLSVKLEKREPINLFMRYLVWPIERQWTHVHGNEVDRYRKTWMLRGMEYQATIWRQSPLDKK